MFYSVMMLLWRNKLGGGGNKRFFFATEKGKGSADRPSQAQGLEEIRGLWREDYKCRQRDDCFRKAFQRPDNFS